MHNRIYLVDPVDMIYQEIHEAISRDSNTPVAS